MEKEFTKIVLEVANEEYNGNIESFLKELRNLIRVSGSCVEGHEFRICSATLFEVGIICGKCRRKRFIDLRDHLGFHNAILYEDSLKK